MDAFDTDVLIYAVDPTSTNGQLIRDHIEDTLASGATVAGVGSVLLLCETLTKPTARDQHDVLAELDVLLDKIELIACDEAIAELAVTLGARHRLKIVDSVHLATAIQMGADRFITNNRRDFDKDIDGIDIAYPEDLVDPGEQSAPD